MAQPTFDIEAAHRWFAKHYNNAAWDLVEAEARSQADAERLLAAAYAAWCHWSAVGTPVNEQRARHLLASAHAELGQGELALGHARRCLALSDENGSAQSPFDRGCAWECMARAYASAGQYEEARRFKQRAREAAADIAADERDGFLQRLTSGRWFGVD